MLPIVYRVESIFGMSLEQAKAEVDRFKKINPQILDYIRENGLAALENELEKLPGWNTPVKTTVTATKTETPASALASTPAFRYVILEYLRNNGPTDKVKMRDELLQDRDRSIFYRALRKLVASKEVTINRKGVVSFGGSEEPQAKPQPKKPMPNRLGSRGVQPFTRHRKMQETLRANGGAMGIEALAKATGFDKVCYNFTISLRSALERGWFTLGDDAIVRDTGKEIPVYDAENLKKGRPPKIPAPSKCEAGAPTSTEPTRTKAPVVVNDIPDGKVRVIDPGMFYASLTCSPQGATKKCLGSSGSLPRVTVSNFMNIQDPRIVTLGCATQSMLDAKNKACKAIQGGHYLAARDHLDMAEAWDRQVRDLTLAIYGRVIDTK